MGNSENSLIFQLACSFSFEKEIRKNGVLESDTFILSSGKAEHGGRDENSFFKKGWSFSWKDEAQRCWGKWGFESGRFFFQVFYKLWLCGYSLLNVKRNEKLINVLMGQNVSKNETNMQMIINLNISSRSVYTWNFNLIIDTKESEVAQSCPTLCDPMDCSLPGSSVHGIFKVRVLEWGAISFSRGSSQPRDQTQVSCIMGRRFTIWATREVWH